MPIVTAFGALIGFVVGAIIGGYIGTWFGLMAALFRFCEPKEAVYAV